MVRQVSWNGRRRRRDEVTQGETDSCVRSEATDGWPFSRSPSRPAIAPATSPDAAPDPNTTVVVEIENHYHGDVVIYLAVGHPAEASRQRHRAEHGRVQLSVAAHSVLRHHRLLAHPIAGARNYASDALLIQPGQSITWTLESDLDRSSLVVY